MRQSVHIIQQGINLIAPGPTQAVNRKLTPPVRRGLKVSMEELINHFRLHSEGFSIPETEVYVGVEAPKGEFGVYLVSNGTNKPYRCKIKAPGFLHLQGLDFMAKNHLIADIVTIVGTLDVVFGEVDR